MFHDLLKILTAYDVGVVICCALQFALPSLWPAYVTNIYPHIMPYLLPVMHITVLTSVYSTILISFERYIRICYYCQLRETSVLSEDNVKFYKLFVVLFPILFYVPKCFEVRSHYVVKEVKMQIDCQKYLSLDGLLENPTLRDVIGRQFTEPDLVKIGFLAGACEKLMQKETPDNVKKNNTLLKGWTEDTGPMYRNITTSMKRELQAESTSLRRNPYYYQIYYVYLNTLFATVLPLSLLLFFNINTAKELIKMSRLGTARNMAVRNPSVTLHEHHRASHSVDPHGVEGQEDMKEALTIAANAHGLHTNGSLENHEPLLSHQGCVCADTALPVITLPRQNSGGLENQIEVHEELADADKLSANGSDILTNMSDEEGPLTGNGNPLSRNGNNGQEIRRSTIMFVIKSNQDLNNVSDLKTTLPAQNGNKNEGPSPSRGFICSGENHSGVSVLASPELRDSNSSLQRAQSMDTNQWSGIKLGRQRASSVWSANSTALRVSITKALNQRNINGTARRPTTTTLLSLNPPGLRNGAGQLGGSSTTTTSRRHSSTSETKKELRLARISLCIVWLFLFCHVWKLVPTIYSTFIADDSENQNEDMALGITVVWPDWLHVIENISHTLITLNSSLNFLIYIVL